MYHANESRYETMKYHRCGDSGLMLPEVSLGFWHNFGDTGVYENMRQMCFTAFDHGSHILIWQTTMDRSRAVRRKISGRSFGKSFLPTAMN